MKRSGRGGDHPTPSCAEVKGKVELYLYSLSGSSWSVLGWTLPLPLSTYRTASLKTVGSAEHYRVIGIVLIMVSKKCVNIILFRLSSPLATEFSLRVRIRSLCFWEWNNNQLLYLVKFWLKAMYPCYIWTCQSSVSDDHTWRCATWPLDTDVSKDRHVFLIKDQEAQEEKHRCLGWGYVFLAKLVCTYFSSKFQRY